mgnify:CR=1 FL=1
MTSTEVQILSYFPEVTHKAFSSTILPFVHSHTHVDPLHVCAALSLSHIRHTQPSLWHVQQEDWDRTATPYTENDRSPPWTTPALVGTVCIWMWDTSGNEVKTLKKVAHVWSVSNSCHPVHLPFTFIYTALTLLNNCGYCTDNLCFIITNSTGRHRTFSNGSIIKPILVLDLNIELREHLNHTESRRKKVCGEVTRLQ